MNEKKNRNFFLSSDFAIDFLIHETDPQSRPVVITMFAPVVCTSVLTFQNLTKQNKVQARKVIATGVNVGLA